VIERLRRLIPGLWAGLLLGVAVLGTPAPFAVLARADAGRVVGHIFAREAWISLALAVLLLSIERQRARRAAEAGEGSTLSTEMLLALAAVFCTVAGYFGLQPLMAQARAGQGSLSFGQLHLISTLFFAGKLLAVLALAWRAVRPSSFS
jgi:hypothetical protein